MEKKLELVYFILYDCEEKKDHLYVSLCQRMGPLLSYFIMFLSSISTVPDYVSRFATL